MPYIKEVCIAGKTIEISKYYSIRWHGKGEKQRKPPEKETSERDKKTNQRKAETKLRRLMNTNFEDGDFLIRLDYSKEKPSGSEEMQKQMQKFIRKIRKELKKVNVEIKYVYVKEIGRKGGRHVHMLMNKCDIDIIRKCWTHGGIHIDPLYTNGQYEKIAEYFVKYASKTEETEGQLIGKRWYGSQNLKKPKITKKVISANKFRKEIKVKKGYQLVKDSVRNGFSSLTGYEYMTYTMIRADKEGGGG